MIDLSLYFVVRQLVPRQGTISRERAYEREGIFPFMELSPELRNRIYEFSVDTPAAGIDVQPVGEYKSMFTGVYIRPSLAAKLKSVKEFPKYDAFFVNQGPGLSCYTERSKPTPVPGILMVSKQVRNEALPVFYHVNHFVFYDCPIDTVTRWLQRTVSPQKQRKHIRSIVWQGEFTRENVEAAMLLKMCERAGWLPPGTVDMVFYSRKRVTCALESALQGMPPLDSASGLDWDAIWAMRTLAETWWRRHKNHFREGYVCAFCSQA
ncbi:hypothetical protein LTR85_001100 [Meristemomyces frigidus]|nr:hypothetical protein LTR85_001100 [Meristemomyces frigidus]